MPRKTAKPINLSDNQKRILEQFARGTHKAQHLSQRAKIILMANEGSTNNDIERQLSLSNHTVIKWRNRFYDAFEKISKVEKETPLKLKDEIIKVFSDEQRQGAPTTFTDVQVAAIIALSLQDPQTLDLPFSHWTCDLLKDIAIDKGIVVSISASQIRRFLKGTRY